MSKRVPASITGIDAAVFGVVDLRVAGRFLDDWGLGRLRSGRSGADFACADRSEVSVRPLDSPRLPPAVEAGPTLREIVWGVGGRRALDAIGRNLARDRTVSEDPDGTVHSTDDTGLAIGFRVTRRRPLKARPAAFNAPGCAVRVNRGAPYYERALPQEISHVVLGVPDIRAVERFYCKRLGFRVSDRYVGRAVFLRASPAGNHHHLFVLNSADRKVHFNHIAFKVRDIHEVIGGGQALAARGWETHAGPGRHYPSSACFWYFKSPLGGAAEYAADEDMVTARWRPRRFVMSPEKFSEWRFNAPAAGGLAGAAIANSRSA
ncbi:MAG TPA: VOC family protein [Burkholderiales bacterium]|nr:VOC family protein [Burkholderiales bacterium]